MGDPQSFAFDDPDAQAAFNVNDAVAKNEQAYSQAQSQFEQNRAFRNYIQQIAKGASTTRGATRYGINSIS